MTPPKAPHLPYFAICRYCQHGTGQANRTTAIHIAEHGCNHPTCLANRPTLETHRAHRP